VDHLAMNTTAPRRFRSIQNPTPLEAIGAVYHRAQSST